jgi:hypothetical protein
MVDCDEDVAVITCYIIFLLFLQNRLLIFKQNYNVFQKEKLADNVVINEFLSWNIKSPIIF